MRGTFQRIVRSNCASIAAAGTELAEWLEAERVPKDASLLARLAVDELVSNVKKYGYDDDREHDVEVVCIAGTDELVVRVTDDGRPFNPVEAAPPILDSPIGERPIGGLGLHLLRALCSRFTYERRDGRNCVTLAKVYADGRDG